MLQDNTIAVIAKLLKLDTAKFTAAVKSDKEETVEIDETLTVLDDGELTTLKNNEYNKGKKTGPEMVIKEYAKEHDIELTGKTLDSLVEAVTTKALNEAKVEVPEQVKNIQAKLENLQKNYKKLEEEKLASESKVETAENQALLYQSVPALDEGMLPVNKLTTLMKSDGYEFVKEDNKLVVRLNGETIVDKTSVPVPIKDVMVKYSADNKLHTVKPDTPPGVKGRAGTDTPKGNTYTRRSELEDAFKADGKSLNGEEFMNAVRTMKKENPDFDLNS